ncbi:MAG TPA: hypothetical protein VK509_08760, partial [Polyangiales bacterium]|nr:hypothetical protein [Polyangiales bacterium]
MPCTPAPARLWLWIAAVLAASAASAASACGGDYWLGGLADGGGRSDDAGKRPPIANERELDDDVVLSGDESFELGDGKTACRLVGHGHAIRSQGAWRGSFALLGCTVVGLGSASTEAISLELSERASATIEGNTFDASGAIHVTNWDDSSTVFRDNTVLESSLVTLDPSFDATTPAFLADGTSPASKLFQGNRIQRSLCWFGSPNWLIGGDSDRESNLVVGLRAGLVLAGSGIVVRGNYVHNLRTPNAGDESALSVIYETTDVLAEHNVLRGGSWVVRGFGGELRYNAILDADYGAWLSQPFERTSVHH